MGIKIGMRKIKKAMEAEVLAWVLLGLLALAVCLGIYAIITGKGSGMIEYIKNLVRFGK